MISGNLPLPYIKSLVTVMVYITRLLYKNLQTAAIVDNILKLLPFDDTLPSLFSCHFIKVLVV